ncbi:hypothetical protein BKA56DRAFT_608589 [Ilyonectria sp. MPI-CAGE-AT-0026]|nr:hypothetical protein BKA56DRAFT_608589 [Ilyonectria sp. MPI-CAGE-AT-0026]
MGHHFNSASTARTIVDELACAGGKVTVDIQDDMVNQRCKLRPTSAGEELQTEVAAAKAKWATERAELERDVMVNGKGVNTTEYQWTLAFSGTSSQKDREELRLIGCAVTRTLAGSADLASPVAIEYATTNELYTLKCNKYDCILNGSGPAMLLPAEELNVPVVGRLYYSPRQRP